MSTVQKLEHVGTTETREPKKTIAGGTTDDAIALAFAERHQDSLRYIAFWNRWLRFDGARWADDQTRHAFDLVRDLCRELAQGRKAADRKTLEAAKKISAVHTLAQADRRIAAEPGAWDPDPDQLNEGDQSP